MRFKTQRNKFSSPNIDLIPMLNVMMSVLAFFVLVSMALTNSPQGVEVQLPDEQNTQEPLTQNKPNPLVITLTANNTFILNNKTAKTLEESIIIVQNYLAKEKKGTVLLVAEDQVSYEKVMQVLTELKAVGGDNVSLGIKSESP